MRSFITILALCAYALAVNAHGHEERQCPEGFVPYLTDCYKVEKTPMTFDDAEDKCLSYNDASKNESRFHLITVASWENQTAIMRKLSDPIGGKAVWIGIAKMKSKPYQWAAGKGGMSPDGAKFDGSGSSKSNCILYINKKWKKTKCNKANVFICSGKQTQYIHHNTISHWVYKNIGCPKLFAAQGKKCYRFFYAKKSWAEAEQRCQQVRAGYHLMSVPSSRENILMKAMFPYQIKKKRVWLGLRKVNGKDAWTDGSRYKKSRRNWDRRSKSKAKNCTALSKTSRGLPKWERVKCEEKHEFICKGGTKGQFAFTLAPTTTTTTTRAPAYGGGGGRGGGGGGGGGSNGPFRPPRMTNCKFGLTQHGPNSLPSLIMAGLMQFIPGSNPQVCMQACKAARGQCKNVMAIPRGPGNYICIVGLRDAPPGMKVPYTQCQGCAFYAKSCKGNCKMVPMRAPTLTYMPKTLKQMPGPNIQQCAGICAKMPECSFIASLSMGQKSMCILLGVGKPMPQPKTFQFAGKGGKPLPLRYAHKVCR